MAKRKTGYADKINASDVLLTGVNNHTELYDSVGVGNDTREKYQNILTNAKDMDKLQEKLKTDLKKATAGLDGYMKQLDAMYSKTKKIVKIHTDREEWLEYGITDKH